MSEKYNYEGSAACVIVCFVWKNSKSIIIPSVPWWDVLALNLYSKQSQVKVLFGAVLDAVWLGPATVAALPFRSFGLSGGSKLTWNRTHIVQLRSLREKSGGAPLGPWLDLIHVALLKLWYPSCCIIPL